MIIIIVVIVFHYGLPELERFESVTFFLPATALLLTIFAGQAGSPPSLGGKASIPEWRLRYCILSQKSKDWILLTAMEWKRAHNVQRIW